jgi:hypothetical protein
MEVQEPAETLPTDNLMLVFGQSVSRPLNPGGDGVHSFLLSPICVSIHSACRGCVVSIIR